MTENFFEDFLDCLKNILGGPKPGQESQIKMAPHPSGLKQNELYDAISNFRHLTPPNSARSSAVIILFYYQAKNIYFPLILRTKYPGVHSGQVSFPGGAQEVTDKNLEETALRECNEEIGVDISKIEIFGSLTDIYIEPSNFYVHPYVARFQEQPEFRIDREEVEELLKISVDELINGPVKMKKKIINEMPYEIPYFDIQDQFIWGATAMILSELKDLAERCFRDMKFTKYGSS
jgi:8-oxo-dGTP pyrophosphatase MutT (NUDIX family)